MTDVIKLKRSAVQGAVPTSLEYGEVALNYHSSGGKLYYKDSTGAIVEFGVTPYALDLVLRSFFVPPQPTSVIASAGNTQATVTWTAPTVLAQTPITDYAVQYSSNGGTTWTAFSDGVSTATSATVTGLTNGNSYTFRVAAVNGVGQGAWSSASAAVTPAAGNIIQTTSGLQVWYDAAGATSVYSAQTGGSVVTADGGLIYRLEDLSGNNRHLKTFDNGTSVPRLAAAVKNSLNGILFDNSTRGDTFKSAANRESGSLTVSNPFTAFAVWYTPTGRNDTYLIEPLPYSWGDRDNTAATGIGIGSGGVYVYQNGIGQGTGVNRSRAGTWVVARIVANGASSKIFVNGSDDTPGGMPSLTAGFGDFIMTGTFTFGEMAVFSGALSNGTCAAIESHLMTKWGIS